MGSIHPPVAFHLPLTITPFRGRNVHGRRAAGTGVASRCQNCGAAVTDRYERVFSPADVEGVRVCPHCDDKLREGSEVREARAPRE